jgi:hypothetical protein
VRKPCEIIGLRGEQPAKLILGKNLRSSFLESSIYSVFSLALRNRFRNGSDSEQAMVSVCVFFSLLLRRRSGAGIGEEDLTVFPKREFRVRFA